ncbi:MAG: glycosyltransferase family 2 protein [Spirochaetaceae bacterium]|nr:glycosyltransferase family 2 protein [Spirochaetaceae bacterium]
MISEPLVSIISPVYNSSETLRDTINSVLRQTYTNWELILIDDKSTDNSREIIVEYTKKYHNIKMLVNDINQGVCYSRNRGINHSNGKYIAFLDSDDLWMERKLEIQIPFMDNRNISLSYTGYYKCDFNLSIRSVINVPQKISYSSLLKTNVMGCLTVVYNKDLLGIRLFGDYILSEDYLLWLELLKELDFAYGVRLPLAKYRVGKTSRSSNKIKAVKYQWQIYRKIEGLSMIKSVFYFVLYLVLGVQRYHK